MYLLAILYYKLIKLYKVYMINMLPMINSYILPTASMLLLELIPNQLQSHFELFCIHLSMLIFLICYITYKYHLKLKLLLVESLAISPTLRFRLDAEIYQILGFYLCENPPRTIIYLLTVFDLGLI